MPTALFRAAFVAAALLTAGCRTGPPPQPKETLTPSVIPTDAWLGRWTGPEGTYLVLSKNGDRYSVLIQSLDGPATYVGIRAADHIEFQRNGLIESIRAGNGQATGMKWLLEKNDCLVIKTGEGFCRD
jgi:hypothetical protein